MEADDFYVLQCVDKNIIFRANLLEIVFNIRILYSLHPIQSAYIGIEYAKHIKQHEIGMDAHRESGIELLSRYGFYALNYQNRKGNICFTDIKEQKTIIMDPRDIILSEKLISGFDASQAFFIGLSAGRKLDRSQPYLKLVK